MHEFQHGPSVQSVRLQWVNTVGVANPHVLQAHPGIHEHPGEQGRTRMNVKILMPLMLLMLSLVVLMGCDGDGNSTEPIETYVDEFLGNWLNEDPNTGGITRVDIRSDGSMLYLHMWGACTPTDCDWGEVSTPLSDANDPRLTVVWDQGFVIRSQIIDYLSDGRLRIESHSNYTDSRPDQTNIYYFYKS